MAAHRVGCRTPTSPLLRVRLFRNPEHTSRASTIRLGGISTTWVQTTIFINLCCSLDPQHGSMAILVPTAAELIAVSCLLLAPILPPTATASVNICSTSIRAITYTICGSKAMLHLGRTEILTTTKPEPQLFRNRAVQLPLTATTPANMYIIWIQATTFTRCGFPRVAPAHGKTAT